MASYTIIKPDGSRETVKYNPRHDGPVSERLTRLKKLKWIESQIKSRPGDMRLLMARSAAQASLSDFDRKTQLTSVPQGKPRATTGRLHCRAKVPESPAISRREQPGAPLAQRDRDRSHGPSKPVSPRTTLHGTDLLPLS